MGQTLSGISQGAALLVGLSAGRNGGAFTVAVVCELFRKEDPPRVKPLLYVYRVLLTGIHLMRTGEVDANLIRLNEATKLSYIPDLVARKLAGPEQGRLDHADLVFHEREYARLTAELKAAFVHSRLPDAPTGAAALNDLLVRIRLKN